MARQKRTTPSLTKFKDDIVRACQFALDVKWENRNNAQMRRREAKRKQEEEQLNWIKYPQNKEWHEDSQDWSQASTSPEKEELKFDNVKIKEEHPSTYKNYIYRGKNWECPICGAEDHCGHYHCTQCQGIHPKDRSFKMRPSRQCKCLKISGSNSGEGEEAY